MAVVLSFVDFRTLSFWLCRAYEFYIHGRMMLIVFNSMSKVTFLYPLYYCYLWACTVDHSCIRRAPRTSQRKERRIRANGPSEHEKEGTRYRSNARSGHEKGSAALASRNAVQHVVETPRQQQGHRRLLGRERRSPEEFAEQCGEFAAQRRPRTSRQFAVGVEPKVARVGENAFVAPTTDNGDAFDTTLA